MRVHAIIIIHETKDTLYILLTCGPSFLECPLQESHVIQESPDCLRNLQFMCSNEYYGRPVNHHITVNRNDQNI